MLEYWLAALMGVVEGITEFLPISSTGHLILVGNYSGFDALVGKDFAGAFKIIIQLGAILAIVAAYPRRFAGLLQFRDNRGLRGFRGLGLLAITTIPAGLLGLAFHRIIERHLNDNNTGVAIALAVGAIWILAVEYWRPSARVENVDDLTWLDALKIGLFQCFALWPGMSRSASTILGGMMSGVERKAATEYSFFAAVPLMLAVTFYELIKHRHLFHGAHLQTLAIGFVVSFVFAWLAVKFFIHFLSRHTLVPFGWYRLAVAAGVFWLAFRGHY